MKLHLTIFAAFICLQSLSCQSVAQKINQFTILEDKNIKVTLLCHEKAGIDKDDWLKLVIKNKSNDVINILKADYDVFEEIASKNGGFYKKSYGNSNKFDLLPSFSDLSNIPPEQMNPALFPGEELPCWKYLTNYASVLLPKEGGENEICPKFKFSLNYAITDNSIEIENPGAKFCFLWRPEVTIPKNLLAERLRRAIKDVHVRWVNTYLVKHLMKNSEAVALISDKELEDGIIGLDKNKMGDEMLVLLEELKRRNAPPVQALTRLFSKDLSERRYRYRYALQFYWDNALLDTLLASTLDHYEIARILDIHADDWSKQEDNCKKVYDALAIKTDFNKYNNPDSTQLIIWRDCIKSMAISRDKKIVDYLAHLLDNEQTFEVEDWSKYARYGILPNDAKPDLVTLRVCDVAYLWLLKATGLTELSLYQMNNSNFFMISLDKAWLADNPADTVKFKFHAYENKFRFMIDAYNGLPTEKLVKLTPTLKVNMKKYLEERRN